MIAVIVVGRCRSDPRRSWPRACAGAVQFISPAHLARPDQERQSVAWFLGMVGASLQAAFTEREYLALEAVAEMRHEFVAGSIVAMAGGELDHNQICTNVKTELVRALGDRPCRVVGSDQRVKVEATGEYFYPDALVVCREPNLVEPKPRSLTNPEVIVEVLSSSTERYDRGDKWLAYQTLPTLTDYVLVASERHRIEHYQRGSDDSWTQRVLPREAKTLTLTDGTTLEVCSLYRLVQAIT
jgi:Uma2 family endonuclease